MKRILFILIPLLCFGYLIFWRIQGKEADNLAQAKMKEARVKAPALVSAAKVSVKDIIHTFEAVGSVESPLNVRISPKVTGRIDSIAVNEGDPVRKGELLVQIDPTQIEAEARQQAANLAEAESRLAQARLTRNPNDVGVTTQIRQQKAALDSETATYNQVRQNLVSQAASAQSSVSDAKSKVESAQAVIANAQASIQSAQANLDNAKAKYKRYQNLYQQGFVAAQDLDDARTTVDVQQGALSVANGQLRSAQAGLDSAQSQLKSAQNQADIVNQTGKADIEAARAKVVQAKAALDFAKSNAAQRPAYIENLAALGAAADAARESLKSAQSQEEDTRLISPIDGFVTARSMDPGAVATAGQQILMVQDLRKVWVSFPAPEEISRKIYKGQPTQIQLDALPGQSFNGKVIQINPSADPSSRQFNVRIGVDNPKESLKPGMFARVTLTLDRAPGAIVAPREAVKDSPDGSSYVMVVNSDDTVSKRPVTVGTSDANDIAILDGVKPGDQVVTMSSGSLKDGQKVRVGGAGGGRKRGGRGAPGGRKMNGGNS